MTCTFFGHRKCPKEVALPLKSTLEDLIEKQNADMFYVGNQGNFDSTVRKILRQLKPIYPHIDYAVVFAYMPCRKNTVDGADFSDTIFPCEPENTPPKYAPRRQKTAINGGFFILDLATFKRILAILAVFQRRNAIEFFECFGKNQRVAVTAGIGNILNGIIGGF